jgi:hypothetical protein
MRPGVRATSRRRRLRRALTRTPVLVAAFVLVVVVVLIVDKAHQPSGCHFVAHPLPTSEYYTRVCGSTTATVP